MNFRNLLKTRNLLIAGGLVASLGLAGCETGPEASHGVTERPALSQKPGPAPASARREALVTAGITPLPGTAIESYMKDLASQIQSRLGTSQIRILHHQADILIIIPGDLSFESGAAALRPEVQPVVATLADILSQHPATYIDINGHADASGVEDTNRVLSEKRARAVAGFLVDHKIAYQRLFVAGLGSGRPIATNDTPDGRARNRRIEIILRPFL